MKSLEEIEMTKCDECYLIIYAMKVEVNIKKQDVLEKLDMYVLVGLNPQGRRKYLGAYLDKKEDHRYWLGIFESLKSKGIQDALFLAVDDNAFLKRCAKVAYPEVNIVPLLIDVIDCFYKYFSDKFSTKIRTEIKTLYLCADKVEYKNQYDLFVEKYGQNSIFVSLINKYLKDVENIYQYNINIRKALFNNYMLKVIKNKIEKLNKKNQFYNDINDIMNLLIENINNIEMFTSYTKKEWLEILEDFYRNYSNRLEKYL